MILVIIFLKSYILCLFVRNDFLFSFFYILLRCAVFFVDKFIFVFCVFVFQCYICQISKMCLILGFYSMKKFYCLYSLLCLCLFSCSDELSLKEQGSQVEMCRTNSVDPSENDQSTLFEMPFASFEELNAMAEYDNVLDYRFARQYAYVEFIDAMELFCSSEICEQMRMLILGGSEELLLTFTDRPVVVYDYNEKPYYYEFGVICQNQIIGVVTVSAQPYSSEIIEFYQSPIFYDEYSYSYKRYIGVYPDVYYGASSSSLFCVKRGSNKEIVREEIEMPLYFQTLYENYANVLEEIPGEDLVMMEEDLIMETGFGFPVLLDSLRIQLDQIWAFYTDLIAEGTFSGDDVFSLSETQRNIISENLQNNNVAHRYFLPEYQNEQLRFTFWGGACGPSAMAWLYRGKWSTYNDFYLRLHGEWDYSAPKNFVELPGSYSYYDYPIPNNVKRAIWEEASNELDAGLYYAWHKETHRLVGGYPLYHGGIDRGLRDATNGEYRIKLTVEPLKWIEENNEPLIMTCHPHGKPHYVAAIGVGYNVNKWGNKKNRYLFVHDNGNLISSNNYYPFWRKYNGFLLYYAWKKQ